MGKLKNALVEAIEDGREAEFRQSFRLAPNCGVEFETEIDGQAYYVVAQGRVWKDEDTHLLQAELKDLRISDWNDLETILHPKDQVVDLIEQEAVEWMYSEYESSCS